MRPRMESMWRVGLNKRESLCDPLLKLDQSNLLST